MRLREALVILAALFILGCVGELILDHWLS
jgi:hypothetical protein